jgi:hypothetical protein
MQKHLRGLGRPLLKRFFEKFAEGLKTCKATLPPESLEDDDYFKALADVFLSPKELPPEMTEVLYAVLEMANQQGVDRLTKAAKEKILPIDWGEKIVGPRHCHAGMAGRCRADDGKAQRAPAAGHDLISSIGGQKHRPQTGWPSRRRRMK